MIYYGLLSQSVIKQIIYIYDTIYNICMIWIYARVKYKREFFKYFSFQKYSYNERKCNILYVI